MSNTYLNNILGKNSQANLSVEPRLKSRFEESDAASVDDSFTNTLDIENPYIQKELKRDAQVSEVNENNFTNNFNTINVEETATNVLNDNQNNFLNTTEHHFHAAQPTDVKNRIDQPEPLLPKIEDVKKESIVIPSDSSSSAINAKSYGILNNPLNTSSKKVDNFNNDYDTDRKENKLTTPEKPSIKISIGRIEVRAVKSSQKISAKPKVKPNLKMSLEDYIDKRK